MSEHFPRLIPVSFGVKRGNQGLGKCDWRHEVRIGATVEYVYTCHPCDLVGPGGALYPHKLRPRLTNAVIKEQQGKEEGDRAGDNNEVIFCEARTTLVVVTCHLAF
ncbi:hypothetical protein CC1G_15292 [Coprinopsis cinerea okayama7|uniref:Uncharacterized protein n=1 Tax=Coprinopsis cinerea (strain Okayama-7 / 130 / ATCC MYA-4618 / FGSC 9003) TaxID=240176 RepID=D6RPX1_COPC7|nr:hypothetical protein CC1G_15292 [Coprinopsis cinerea okayama7\|eukprot:XP_002910385.1 hypothetical protein CC1G_15292 [Coprinopsis cinerea okayama7\